MFPIRSAPVLPFSMPTEDPLGFLPGSSLGLLPSALREPERDVFVYQSRPGQNRVPYYDFLWRTYDFKPTPGGGGVRLYYYERERGVAAMAAASIRAQYERLSQAFHYIPRSRFPYILYGSYTEFQATNVFFISEGTLGATDPRDLRMSLPFFGSLSRFERVSSHEMSHQFHIQKMRDASMGGTTPLSLFTTPLWFVEGVAEHFSIGAIGPDAESELLLRDVVLNPAPDLGYRVYGFFDERPGGYIGVYKLGQARVQFLAETYGQQKLLELLGDGPAPVPSGTPAPATDGGAPPTPEGTVPAAPEQSDGGLAPPAQGTAPGIQGQPDGGSTPSAGATPSPAQEPADGGAVPSEPRRPVTPASQPAPEQPSEKNPPEKKPDSSPGDRKGLPGEESPGSRFAHVVSGVVGDSEERIEERFSDWLRRRYYDRYLKSRHHASSFREIKQLAGEPDAFVVSTDGRLIMYRTVERETGITSLYLQDLRDRGSRVTVAQDGQPGLESLHPVDRRVMALGPGVLAYVARTGKTDSIYVRKLAVEARKDGERLRVSIDLGSAEPFDLAPFQLYEAFDPALDATGQSLAFAAIDETGMRDLYLMSVAGEQKGRPRRLTHDYYAERELSFDGQRLLYVSDATEHGKGNLFALNLASGKSERLTYDPVEQSAPVATDRGILFRSEEGGKPDIWVLRNGQPMRLTDFDTGLLQAAIAGQEVLLLGFHQGGYHVYRANWEDFLYSPAAAQAPPATPPAPRQLPVEQIPEQSPMYQPWAFRNWRVEGGGAALVGGNAVGAGGMNFTDIMRDRMLATNVAVYGELRLTDALAMYTDRSSRPELGLGAFHTFEARRDKTFPQVENFFLQRMFGLAGVARYPFNRFQRVEGILQLQGLNRFDFTDSNGVLLQDWERLNGGIDPDVELTTLFGHDTMRLHAEAGPLEGSSVLFSTTAGYLPLRQNAYGRATMDAQHRLRIVGRTQLLMRAGGGVSAGGRFSPQFFLSSLDNFRGYNWGDRRLLGADYYLANAELSFPLDWLLATRFSTAIYGIAGFDFVGTFDDFDLATAWKRRALAGVLGSDFVLGPIVLRTHFGKCIDIGGEPAGPWVFNLNIRYLYF